MSMNLVILSPFSPHFNLNHYPGTLFQRPNTYIYEEKTPTFYKAWSINIICISGPEDGRCRSELFDADTPVCYMLVILDALSQV
jgi:hypothetical protein